MKKTTGKWASFVAMGAIISAMPATAENELGAFDDRSGATQMTVDLVIPFGGPAAKKAQNAPRLQLGMAYEPRSRSSGSEYDVFRPREKRTSNIGFTLDKDAVFMLNGKPVTVTGKKASLNTIETVGVVLGGLALVAGGLILYADSVIDNNSE